MEVLAAEGWSLRKGAYDSLAEVCNEQHITLRDAALNADLRKMGDAALPGGIGKTAGPLKEPHVLQIVACTDVGKPSKGGVAGSSAKRLLCFTLTDGKATCKALEMRLLPDAEGERVAPGAKVLISGATVKAGVILADARSLQMLGGRVEELFEGWEFQRKFGGSARPAPAADAAAELDRPPQFKTFVPGKTRVPKRPPAEGSTSGHATSVNQNPEADSSHSRPVDRGVRVDAPPGFEHHAPSQKSERAQQPQHAPHLSRGATSASRAEAEHGSPAGSMPAREATTLRPASQVPRSLAGETAARQLQGSTAAKARLQERLAATEQDQRGRGRGRGRGRRGRYREEEEESGMTLEEWEAQQGARGPDLSGSALSDEALARQLQRQLDLEDAELAAAQQDREPPRSAEADLRACLFAFDQPAQGLHDRGRGGFRQGGRGRRY